MRRLTPKFLLALLMVLIALAALEAPAVQAAKKPPPPPTCLCPDVMDPVICSNGQTYSNFCYAGCAGATGCTRTGDI